MPRVTKKPGHYHHGDLHRVLLDAALRVVEREGVHALNLEALARRAGVSPGAPYHHFPSRAHLLSAIAADGFRVLVTEMRAAAAAARDARSQLENLGRAYIGFALGHLGHFRVMFRPEAREHLGKESDTALDAGLTMLREAMVRAQQEGAAPPGDVTPLVLVAWSTVHGAATLWSEGSLREEALATDAVALADTVAATLVSLLAGDAQKK